MAKELYIGLMSGTSLDGVDAALCEIDDSSCSARYTEFIPYPSALRQQLLALHQPSPNELELVQLTANHLSALYAQAVAAVLKKSSVAPNNIQAIGCHGQTIRHRPELGFTLQIGNASLLAELSGITVVSDFRSRDISAGGQGAPLVPAFHHAVFPQAGKSIAVLNIGGISNITYLNKDGSIAGFDSGPGNLLMDAWIEQHKGITFDRNGDWAASGQVIPELLDELLLHPFFSEVPPKSTGRDFFHLDWLNQHLQAQYGAQDVQCTLLELTARSIAQAINKFCGAPEAIYVCGGGAHNQMLLSRLKILAHPARIGLTDELGIAVDWVEAAAFAWLARQCIKGKPGNLPAVTGANGERILGAIYAS